MFIRNSKIRVAVLSTTAIVMNAGIASAQSQSPPPNQTQVQNQTAAAQTATNSSAPADQAIETVVVTGSHIHGIAPVGSVVVDVSAADLAKMGATTVTDLLRDLPQVTNIGFDSTGQNSGRNLQGGGGNGNYGRTINLRGIASQDTLTLVNGMRMVPSQSGTIWDIDSIPTLLVQRLDVVADGGSAIYGADAVTGTVNILYKAPIDINQIQIGAGHTKGQTDYQANTLIGRTWDAPGLGEGGIMWAVSYFNQDKLYASQLPAIYFDNYQPFLGSSAPPLSNFVAPGNAVINGTTYGLPGGLGATQGLALSQLRSTVNRGSVYNSQSVPIPDDTRWATGFNFKQDLTSWLHFQSNGYMEWRRANAGFSAGDGTQATTISVPNTNPYSPCYTGQTNRTNSLGITCPANGTISVQENLQSELGPNYRNGRDKAFMVVGGFDVDLPYDWKGSITTNLSGDHSDGQVVNAINTTAFNQTVSGVNKPTNVPFFNPFCVSNVTTPCNNSLTDAYIDAGSDTIYTNNISETVLNFDGPIYHLPGGDVRLAVGGAYENEGLNEADYSLTTPALGVKISTPAIGHKNVASWYGEMFVPLVGDANAMWGVQSLALDLANRYTAYSDFGVTDNPKLGLNYTPFNGFKIHTSFGTSFRAPSIRDESPNIEQQIFVNNNVSAATYPGITIPTGTTSTSLTDIQTTGGQPGIKPETGRTWSLGFDWAADKVGDWDLHGLNLSVNYYNIHLVNQIDQVARTAGSADINNPIYSLYNVYNPTYFPTRAIVTPAAIAQNPSLVLGAPLTQAQFNAIAQSLLANPLYAQSVTAPTGPIIFFTDQRRANSGRLRTDGFDFSANYGWDLGWATADVGMAGTYVWNYNAEITPISGSQDLDNTFTFPLRFTDRLHGALQIDGWEGTIYLTYRNPYRADPTLLVPLAPVQFQHINSSYPVDISLSYDTAGHFGPYFNDALITLAMTNVFSQRPPLVLGGNVNYDATEASALGRHVELTLEKKF